MSNGNPEQEIVSIFLDTPSLYDRVVRRATDHTYVVEYQYPIHAEYGGFDQKKHQRRYSTLAKAMRRFNYLLVTRPLHAAYILSVPIDLEHYTEKARQAGAVCCDCGGHNWKFDEKEHDSV